MERRRTNKPEDVVWAKVFTSLATLEAAHISSNEKIAIVNNMVENLPSTAVNDPNGTSQPHDSQKTAYRKLHVGVNNIKTSTQDELKAISDALEHVSVLIALKTNPEQPPVQEKRAKRARLSSPASGSRTPGGTPPPPPTLTIPARPIPTPLSASVSFSREPKARREALAGQLPLQEGRKVAFRPPPNKSATSQGHGDPKNKNEGDAEENSWILAVVVRCINQDKNRYEVQDVDEDGGLSYNTTLRALIPLPDPTAPPGSITHPSSFPEFPKGSIVMAQYPDTTVFYRAEVIAGPKDNSTSHTKGALPTNRSPIYRLRFDDDDGQLRTVQAHLVVEWPGDA